MAFWDWLGLGGEKADNANHLENIETVLATVTPERARYLACFAYILTRPARADHQVTDDEAAQMRAIIVQQAGVGEEQAAAIVSAARVAAKQAGGTEDFLVTREFERIASREQKLHLLDCLFSISAADASILTVEDNEVRRVASELKLEHADYIAVRRKHLEHLEVLRRKQP